MALKDLSFAERKIIGRYLDRVADVCAENPTHFITVTDEEEPVYQDTFNRALIEAAIGDTDYTRIRVRVGADQVHSTFFVHGNDEDVVSDSSWSAKGEWLEEKLLKGVY